MTKKEENDVSYIKIDSPLDARKTILNAAIQATYILRYIESYKQIKARKLEIIREINAVMEKIERETIKLKGALPKEKEIQGIEPIKIKEEKSGYKDPLEKDLEEIRRRLLDLRV